MVTKLHIGKLTKEVSTTVTEEFAELMTERARLSNCKLADVIREGLYMLFTSDTYSGHVAKDRSAAFRLPPQTLPETTGNDIGSQS